MIYVTNFKGLKGKERSFDEIWACVRSLKSHDPRLKQVADLSPSRDLFFHYLSAKKAGKFDRIWFEEHYIPQFIFEMHSPAARELLNTLYKADKCGKRICLVCFCEDEGLCHRSILAGLLQGVGCDVHGVKSDYSDYYRVYRTQI